jgi:hypothetical protein
VFTSITDGVLVVVVIYLVFCEYKDRLT